jgi:signal peptidase I
MLMSAATQAAQSVSSSSNAAILSHPRAASPFRRVLQQVLQCIAVAVLATASYFIISNFLLQSVKVVGRSMVPTLSDSEHYLLNRWIYSVHAPQRKDIVVLRDPSDNGFSVKRIIAMPGDSIYLNNGSVYVNGCKLEEAYLAPGTPTFADSKEHERLIRCGKDQYFVLGDNRVNSIDSRTYGPVPRANILGPLIR